MQKCCRIYRSSDPPRPPPPHYSLNLADDTFKEQEQVEAGKELKYYVDRENMASRKVELNDKLKAVHLIKAI